MKYMQHGGFQHRAPMRLTLALSDAFLAGLWLTGFGMYFQRMGLSPASVREYYLGSPDGFSNPRSYASMLETAHAHFGMMAVVLLLLTHIVLFADLSEKKKKLAAWAAFSTAFLQEAAGWLTRFVHPDFAVLKVAGFLAFQAVLGWLVWTVAAFLYAAAREEAPAQPHGHGHHPHKKH